MKNHIQFFIEILKTLTLSLAIVSFVMAFLFQIQKTKEGVFLSGIAKCWRDRSLPLFSHIKDKDEAVVMALMNSVHHMMRSREDAICGASLDNPSSPFRWISEDLNDPGGACAGYSRVLGRLLLELGYDVRKIGLEKGEDLSIHHVIEVKVDNRWVMLDPWFNLAFRNRDGSLAGASELSRSWQNYRRQTPDQYSPDYNFQAYHYTNWKRLGLLGTLLKKVFDSGAGEEFSAFKYIVRKDRYLPLILCIFGLLMLCVYVLVMLKSSRSVNIPPANG